MSEDRAIDTRWADGEPFTIGDRETPVPYFPGMRVTEGTQIRLPGGALFQVLSIRRDEEGNPGVLSLTLEPISDDA